MRLPDFEALVSDALDELPRAVKEMLENVDVVVQLFPTREQMREHGMRNRYDLLGLYDGVPITDRGGHYGMVLPDKVTLFKGPLEALYGGSEETLAAQVRHTVKHELAHHFGISDEQLEEMGRY